MPLPRYHHYHGKLLICGPKTLFSLSTLATFLAILPSQTIVFIQTNNIGSGLRVYRHPTIETTEEARSKYVVCVV